MLYVFGGYDGGTEGGSVGVMGLHGAGCAGRSPAACMRCTAAALALSKHTSIYTNDMSMWSENFDNSGTDNSGSDNSGTEWGSAGVIGLNGAGCAGRCHAAEGARVRREETGTCACMSAARQRATHTPLARRGRSCTYRFSDLRYVPCMSCLNQNLLVPCAMYM
jgi:hypothetical protein